MTKLLVTLIACLGLLATLPAQDYAYTLAADSSKAKTPRSWFKASTLANSKPASINSFWRGRSSKDKLAAAQLEYSIYKYGIPEARNLGQYVTALAVVRHRAKASSLCKQLDNTDRVCYDPDANLLGVFDASWKGTTLFRPKEGAVFYKKVLSSPAYTYLGATVKDDKKDEAERARVQATEDRQSKARAAQRAAKGDFMLGPGGRETTADWLHHARVPGYPMKKSTDWSPDTEFGNLATLYAKYRRSFPTLKSSSAYLKAAYHLREKVPTGTLSKQKANGDLQLYHPATNVFAVYDADNRPKFMARPTLGADYFNNLPGASSRATPPKPSAQRMATQSDHGTRGRPKPNTRRGTAAVRPSTRGSRSTASRNSPSGRSGAPSSAGRTHGDKASGALAGNGNQSNQGTQRGDTSTDNEVNGYAPSPGIPPRFDDDEDGSEDLDDDESSYDFRTAASEFGQDVDDWKQSGDVPKYQKPAATSAQPARSAGRGRPYGNPLTVRTYLPHADVDRWAVKKKHNLPSAEYADRFYQQALHSGLTGAGNLKEFTAAALGLLYDQNLQNRLVFVQNNVDVLVYDRPYQLFAAFNYRGEPISFKLEPDERVLSKYRDDDNGNGDPRLDTAEAIDVRDRGLTGAIGHADDTVYPLKPTYRNESKRGGWQEGRTVRYFGPEQRRKYEVFVDEAGRLTDAEGTPLDTRLTAGAHKGTDKPGAICVMDPNGRIYLSNLSFPAELHHSSFLSGGPVTFAGEFFIENGLLRKVTNMSGHYKPAPKSVVQVLGELYRRGVDVSGVDVQLAGG